MCTIQAKTHIFGTYHSDDCLVHCNCYVSLANQRCVFCSICLIVRVCGIFHELRLCVLAMSLCWKVCSLRRRILSSLQSNCQTNEKRKKVKGSIQYFSNTGLREFLRDHTLSNVLSVSAGHRLFSGVHRYSRCLLPAVHTVHLPSLRHKTYLSRRTSRCQDEDSN